MVRGGGYVEAEKRIEDIQYSWAISTINKVVNEALNVVEADTNLKPKERLQRVLEIEKAWQRILIG
jgi:7,8-dihydro-6-hydroxymethylpterin-pyrophosphokinase|tara:strand:- start:533 stop:730 length:198 start_codon:yes stop_codon:yes gene_type:complete